jgi:hypothetical protein
MSHVEPIDGIGRTAYEQYCELLGLQPDYALRPAQRVAALPSWLSPELASTPAAREKLRTYGRRHLDEQLTSSGTRTKSAPTVADVLSQIWCLGADEHVAAALASTLADARIPAPVRTYALERCTFIGLGARVAGFCGCADLTSPDGRARPRLVVLAAHEPFDALVAHELAHCWTLPEPDTTSRNGSAVWQSALYDVPLAVVPGTLLAEAMDRRRSYARDEDVAERLAARWGFGAVCDAETGATE